MKDKIIGIGTWFLPLHLRIWVSKKYKYTFGFNFGVLSVAEISETSKYVEKVKYRGLLNIKFFKGKLVTYIQISLFWMKPLVFIKTGLKNDKR